jgi:hypothetical protein
MRSDPGFDALKERLLRAGIGPRRVRRYLAELTDHLAELTAQEEAAGDRPAEAATRARILLGSDDDSPPLGFTTRASNPSPPARRG